MTSVDQTEGTFTAQLWRDTAEWRDAIENMPFIRTLADGSLPESAFSFYLAQDAFYLVEFARALALASAHAPTVAGQAFFAGSAHTALAVESSLHHDWLTGHPCDTTGASPVTAAYTDHLLAVAARDSYPILAAAVLPCYWLYAHIGDVIVRRAGDLSGNPYQRWIGTYADPDFQTATATARGLVDEAADTADAVTRQRMREVFARSCMHEYLFFHQGTERPAWPTPATVAASRPDPRGE
jgi:hydroxymethylpyrimidine/phosphomethylpyrimidine kinase/hydroxymethylpyrimidine kinase/phosphomethylpyrimidine kinase/thiamine-phosphate diphosphorylase